MLILAFIHMIAVRRGGWSIHPPRRPPDEPDHEPLMRDLILSHEPAIRLGFFFGVFALMALWEVLAPRRSAPLGRWARWPSNLGIVVLNTVLVRLLLPTTAVALAMVGEAEGWGLLHQIALPAWLGLIVGVVALDLVVYLQHVMVHAVPVLWRLHRVHHADLHFDVTTGARFHPIEILLSMLIKLAAILVIGPPPEAVVVFEVLLNATAMFNHGNVRLPAAADRWLAGHAPRPPLGRGRRDQQQLRLQPAVVGPAVRHLPRPAACRPRRHDHRHPWLS